MKIKTLMGVLLMCIAPLTSPTPTAAGQKQDGDNQSEGFKESLEVIIRGIDGRYPIKEKADKIIESLREASKNSTFFNQDEPSFVKAVNKVLWDSSHDLHLKLYDKAAMEARYKKSGSKRSPRIRRRVRPSGDSAGGPPPAMGTSVVESEMINADTGIFTFKTPIYRNPEIYTPALEKLEGADNIIIDLRNVPGGTNFGVNYFLSQFYSEPTLLSAMVSRQSPEPRESWSTKTELGKRFTDKNLYVLVNEKTASGAEAVAFSLKNTGRATIIGSKTAGAGNAGQMLSTGYGLTLFLPIAQAINPATGEIFEGIGVSPDIKTKSEDALKETMTLINKA